MEFKLTASEQVGGCTFEIEVEIVDMSYKLQTIRMTSLANSPSHRQSPTSSKPRERYQCASTRYEIVSRSGRNQDQVITTASTRHLPPSQA